MSDKQDDRDKPKPSSTDDKTRIAAKRHRPPAAADDKTRIAAAKTPPTTAADDDKTRIAVRRQRSADTNSTAEQAASDNDKTRIAPKRAVSKPASAAGLRSNTAAGLVSGGNLIKNRFELGDVLGVGGMGVVYKARDLVRVETQDRDPYVAIKVLNDEFKQHPEAVITLQRESTKSQSIAHPNIVNVFDFDRDGDRVFMTMEYMEGEPLDKLLKRYHGIGLPTDDAWGIIKDMCAALSHAHDRDLIHSDFKPGNVFVTSRGVTKVFDFGIARAVANVQRSDDHSDDRTVFDAGDLGALTPSYASLEMLEGDAPDMRDDVYALGCVIYEIFTGGHPFNKVPADEAREKGLKPKRIPSLSRRQWSAIEKSLAFKREDRIDSVDTLLHELTVSKKPTVAISTALALLLSVGIVAYFMFFQPEPKQISADDIRNKAEFEVRLKIYKDQIEELLASPSFTSSWEGDLWAEIQGVRELLADDSPWLEEKDKIWLIATEATIITAYTGKIDEQFKRELLDAAKALIGNAQRYNGDKSRLERQVVILSQLIERAEQRREEQRLLAEQRAREAAEAEAARQAARVSRAGQTRSPPPPAKAEDNSKDPFVAAQNNVKAQLKCRSQMNMRDLGVAVKKLRSTNSRRYTQYEPELLRAVANCISSIGRSHPKRAEDYKRDALRLFNQNKTIAAIRIVPRDDCNTSIAGKGGKSRSTCRDRLGSAGQGPVMVVMPAKGAIKPFAIGRYEVSIAEFNRYCQQSKACSAKSGNTGLPVTGISIKQVNAYLKWLSEKSKRKYRLPSKKEWVYAAKSTGFVLDNTANCILKSRGLNKGGILVKATAGKANAWGLVNFVGNAQELVYDQGRKLMAAGGSFEDPMSACIIKTQKPHNGAADSQTGFRVLRELKAD